MTRRSTFTDQSVTYGAIGATLDPDFLRYPPAGYRPAEDSVRLGSGAERFERAAESLMTWGIQRGAGFTVTDVSEGTGAQYPGIVYGPDGAPLAEQPGPRSEVRYAADGTQYITAGMTATLQRKRRVGTARTPVLVVYVIDEPKRIGFAYGTTSHGPETVRSPSSSSTATTTPCGSRSVRSWPRRAACTCSPGRGSASTAATSPAASCAPCTPRAACRRGIRPAARRTGARRWAAARICRRGRAASRLRRLPARAVLPRAVRVLRLQHLHVRRAARGATVRLRGPGDQRGADVAARARGIRGADPTGADRVLRRRHARPCCRRPTSPRCSAQCATSSASPTGAEVTTEANPDSVGADDLVRLAEGGFTRVSFGMQSAVPHVLAALDRTHDPGRDPARRRLGARRRTRREPRPHLRHAGGVARRLARQRSSTPSPSSPTTSAHTRSSSRRARSSRGRSGAASSPRPTTTSRPTCTSSPTSLLAAAGLRLVRGQQLGDRRRASHHGTTSATGGATTGGASAPARTATSAACAGGTPSTRRPTPTV